MPPSPHPCETTALCGKESNPAQAGSLSFFAEKGFAPAGRAQGSVRPGFIQPETGAKKEGVCIGCLQGRKDQHLARDLPLHGLERGSAARRRSADLRPSGRALAWEREQLSKMNADLDMTFESFVSLYRADVRARLKENTWSTKEHIFRTKLLPYFGKLKMRDISAQHVIAWQNEMLKARDARGKPYSPRLPQDRSQPAQRRVQPRGALLQPARKPLPQGRQHGQEQGAGDAVLDQGGISQVLLCHHGQAPVLLRL